MAMEKVEQLKSKPRKEICRTDSPQLAKVGPTIRVIHIFSPIVVMTDKDNFRSLVQKLTGREATRSERDLASSQNTEQNAKKRKLSTQARSDCQGTGPSRSIPNAPVLEMERSYGFPQQSVLTNVDKKLDVVPEDSVSLDILSDSSQLDDIGSCTSTDLHDISTAGEIDDMGIDGTLDLPSFQHLSTPRAAMLPGMREMLQDQLVFGSSNYRCSSSPPLYQTFDPFTDQEFLYGYEDTEEQRAAAFWRECAR